MLNLWGDSGCGFVCGAVAFDTKVCSSNPVIGKTVKKTKIKKRETGNSPLKIFKKFTHFCGRAFSNPIIWRPLNQLFVNLTTNSIQHRKPDGRDRFSKIKLLHSLNEQKMTTSFNEVLTEEKLLSIVKQVEKVTFFFAKQFIHFQKRDTKNTENKSLHTFNKC